MTVEQPVRTSYGRQSREHADIAKIEEVTGITDYQRINEAICQCRNEKGNYELEDVITVLLTDPQPQPRKAVDIPVSHTKTAESSTSPSRPSQDPTASTKKDQGVIDLTGEPDDMQKAIAASLKESQPGILGGQISREEQEISRALEASLAESKAGTKRKRGDIWFVDPLNPHERKRHENWPVGLKNVGNTCWFSAVIQSLFHIPYFRHLVLQYGPPAPLAPNTVLEKHKFDFMSELRHLFALMVASRRKYVDPSRAVEILKQAFSPGVSSVDNQQDVSEFQHKLLEWLEEAFRSDNQQGVAAGQEPGSSNPMVQLFYGQVLAEGANQGKRFENKENFGQFPLQVDGFQGIHESLEAATARGHIESVSGDVTALSVQEQWFTSLPPVLTFELSRFQFNQQLGRPEKIHNKLDFPELIYMDRYMEVNKQLTRQKREELRRLRDKLSELHTKLDKFVNYGSGSKRFPLQDVLQYALEFAESSPRCQNIQSHDAGCPTTSQSPSCQSSPASSSATLASPTEDPSPHHHSTPSLSSPSEIPSPVPMSAPSLGSPCEEPATPPTSVLSLGSPCEEPSPLTTPGPSLGSPCEVLSPIPIQATSDIHMDSPSSQLSMQVDSPSPEKQAPPDITMHTPPRGPSLMAPSSVGSQHDHPTPRHITQEELCVLQVCLQRWRREVEADVKELQDSISGLEDKVNGMYQQDDMQQHPYKLHAVLVHEGQAASGHYWAYVYSMPHSSWLKFNDIAVSEVGWEDVQRESVGGYHNASAYCLMYINAKRHDLLQEGGWELDSLPADLQKLVAEDNSRFSREITDWDNEQQRRLQMATPVGSPASPATAASSSTDHDNKQGVRRGVTVKASLPVLHAHFASADTTSIVRHILDSDTFKNKGPADAFLEACRMEMKRIDNLYKALMTGLPQRDARLANVVLYLRANYTEGIVQRALVEQFAFCSSLDSSPESKQIRSEALRQLDAIKHNLSADQERDYHKWHECYSRYRQIALHFINGLQLFLQDKYMEALHHLVLACDINVPLVKNERFLKGMDTRLLCFFRRQCLLKVNSLAAGWFEEDQRVAEALQLMTGPILACVSTLTSSPYPEDQAAIELIREKWCSFLGNDLGSRQEQLPDLMERLCDPPSELRYPYPETLQRLCDQDLARQYEVTMHAAEERGLLLGANNAT